MLKITNFIGVAAIFHSDFTPVMVGHPNIFA